MSKPNKVLTVDEQAGTVSFTLSLGKSANFQSSNCSLGVTIPILPKETVQDAMVRVQALVEKHFTDNVPDALALVDQVRERAKNVGRHGR